jgi:hypothetical protein
VSSTARLVFLRIKRSKPKLSFRILKIRSSLSTVRTYKRMSKALKIHLFQNSTARKMMHGNGKVRQATLFKN